MIPVNSMIPVNEDPQPFKLQSRAPNSRLFTRRLELM
jgi:hypothetical protein